MPAGTGLPLLANVADGQRRDGPPELVVGREYSVIPMPVLPRRPDEVGEPVQELKRRQLDDAGPCGLPPTTPPDPVRGFVSGQHVADAGDPEAVQEGGATEPRAGSTRCVGSSGDTGGRDQSPLDLVEEDSRDGGDGSGSVGEKAPQPLG